MFLWLCILYIYIFIYIYVCVCVWASLLYCCVPFGWSCLGIGAGEVEPKTFEHASYKWFYVPAMVWNWSAVYAVDAPAFNQFPVFFHDIWRHVIFRGRMSCWNWAMRESTIWRHIWKWAWWRWSFKNDLDRKHGFVESNDVFLPCLFPYPNFLHIWSV